MGLTHRSGPSTWNVRSDFESVLRAMQRAADRQRVLAAHGVVVSDERLPIEVLELTRADSVEGRILVHGEDEQSGRRYLMLEGTDARVHFIEYTSEMEAARARGELKPNAFARFRRTSADGDPALEIEDLGDADALVNIHGRLEATARALIKRGILPAEDGWGGWLGRYQSALRRAHDGIGIFALLTRSRKGARSWLWPMITTVSPQKSDARCRNRLSPSLWCSSTGEGLGLAFLGDDDGGGRSWFVVVVVIQFALL
ncbi:MAG: DUF3363 domain-containing protein [Acidobacteriia bacterium]|nr:DUF3363 domain-containing protein [Terriglobia bacterium]